MRYVVVYERTHNGWAAYVPDLPGCIAAADTRKDVALLIKEAVKHYVAASHELDQTLPKPGRWTETVEV